MTESITPPFSIGDRVSRPDIAGPVGTVKKVRIETTRDSLKQDDDEPGGVTVTVLWDNGTLSHFVPEALKLTN